MMDFEARVNLESKNLESETGRGALAGRGAGRRRDTAIQAAGALLASLALLLSCAQDGAAPAPTANAGESAEKAPKLLEKLGPYHREITTSSDLAQRYFDQGMVLTFGFNHDAAVRSFEEAARLDPECAMCVWGIGFALGPNINAPMGPDAGKRAHAATQKALALAGKASDRERAYIEALAVRYSDDPAADRAALDRAFADAMKAVHEADPLDDDAATLYAEALMDLMPWAYWKSADEPQPDTPVVLELLEGVMERDPDHVGANHFYIHAVEEYHPERAEPAADRLGGIAPDAGHLVHMPSHIFWRVGRYQDAAEINQKAIEADEQYFAWCRPGAFYRALYYPHNVHFLWSASATEGISQVALTAARKLAAKTEDGVGDMPFLQEFLTTPMLTLVRFGMWDAVLGEPKPPEGRVYQVGMWHYARGVAFARRDDADRAKAELAALVAAAADPAAEELILAGGTSSAKLLLSVGVAHLEGELASLSGDSASAIAKLEEAVELQDALVYMEPPPWYVPNRQLLGAALLEADRAPEAEAVYREDLKRIPKNGWSLYGLAQSLEAQGETQKAAYARKGFEQAWARADVELEASRF